MAKKYHNFASGWVKQGEKGQYISATTKTKSEKAPKVELYVSFDGAEPQLVENFAVYFQEKNPKYPTSPDVRFTFTTEE